MTTPCKIGVLSLQGAFEEHQQLLESLGCETVQVRTTCQLNDLDGIVLPGGESTAMGLIGSGSMWESLRQFIDSGKPAWGTCAGMILLADRCVGSSAVIKHGQSLIGGMNVLVCRNYFGSQVSSFEMPIPCPPGSDDKSDYPGVFIRAPAILTAEENVEVLGKVSATPCRQAAAVLKELDRKIAAGEDVVMMGVVDALRRDKEQKIIHDSNGEEGLKTFEQKFNGSNIILPGAAEGTDAREVICAVRKQNMLCTAFHPELTKDSRWHQYFVKMVDDYKKKETS